MRERTYDYPILEVIKERWSARAFLEKPVAEQTLRACLEAARYAPSCYNEQPWRYMIPADEEELELLRTFLYRGNRTWADRAPLLLLILSKKTFEKNGKDNRFHAFDAGTSFGFFSLQATALGLIAHPMAGFKRKTAAEELQIPEDYEVLCMVAVGYHGDVALLPPEHAEEEYPNTRVALDEIIVNVKKWLAE
jgi:nitroreductase